MLKLLILGILSINIAFGQIELCPSFCKINRGFEDFKITNKTLLFSSYNLFWEDAMKKCQEMGGGLINIENSVQSTEVFEFLKKNAFQEYRGNADNFHVWIGANDLDSHLEFRWKPSNKPMTFTSWAINQPGNEKGTEHCVEISWIDSTGIYWNDENCDYPRRFLCELPFNTIT